MSYTSESHRSYSKGQKDGIRGGIVIGALLGCTAGIMLTVYGEEVDISKRDKEVAALKNSAPPARPIVNQTPDGKFVVACKPQ
jgi:hypothetical protein